ncbi:hypothetical protein DSM43518_00073 [Mycobacterium marinum]|uniref:Uncharacterized protein n=2 Tax=Mycobacterium ulcerans group TaxID=2993898 RepID=A0A3E2N0M1_MYCMR|nr:hypothetical protein MULP_00811 [Mycobacterium liflandii 128FXT]AXN42703.1 hypothetical protein MM1218R_00749 [Mycobacterium marinum]QYL27441.1 hypothetical protein TM48_01659 [Mycobacterium shottsii]BEH75102.1 hypothetical protein YM3MPS_09050 [Mycobacterium pseudoshottsii]AXN48166.1 hypothetical protein CCUG20998_00743 [Mycobacterium marinum]
MYRAAAPPPQLDPSDTPQLTQKRPTESSAGRTAYFQVWVTYLTKVNCPTLLMPLRKKFSHPVR